MNGAVEGGGGALVIFESGALVELPTARRKLLLGQVYFMIHVVQKTLFSRVNVV
eukprot:SAG31_NODE_754_length_12324_cov_3.930061_5_plen_54_part_00